MIEHTLYFVNFSENNLSTLKGLKNNLPTKDSSERMFKEDAAMVQVFSF